MPAAPDKRLQTLLAAHPYLQNDAHGLNSYVTAAQENPTDRLFLWTFVCHEVPSRASVLSLKLDGLTCRRSSNASTRKQKVINNLNISIEYTTWWIYQAVCASVLV